MFWNNPLYGGDVTNPVKTNFAEGKIVLVPNGLKNQLSDTLNSKEKKNGYFKIQNLITSNV